MPNNDQLVIPVQTCKLTPPRDCTADETRETLNNWLEVCKNYFAGDDNYRRFVLPGATWDPDAEHFGFTAEGQQTKLRRTAVELEAALRRFWSSIAAFFPWSFMRKRLERSTSWESIRQIILTVYNFQLNGVSFLQFSEIKRGPNENPFIFYERIHDFFLQHVVGRTMCGTHTMIS